MNLKDFEHMAGVHPMAASLVLFIGVLVFGLIVMGVIWSTL